MFNSIRGTITEKLPDTLRIATGGVEWDITVPGTDLNRFPPAGEEGRVFLWLYHREDQMKLYGFADESGRHIFLELLKVEGIGPRGAIKIMGGITQEELERALENEDLGRLEAVPGLGKKTAQKMILALKGKLAVSRAASPAASAYEELVEALAAMGYDRRAAASALARAEETLEAGLEPAEREQRLFRQAIVYLSGL
ncbi:MAG: Holliday junction branch migration protein RuvA [Treponema sp.]|jgi:Holliday junction DNA helicase RuvA|nr:Holliday junction branch migration protein RuvA [Treponema sp.]